MENEDIKIYSVYSYYRYEPRIMLRKHEEYEKNIPEAQTCDN